MCEGLSSGNDELLQLNECYQLCWSITQQIEREKTKSSENIEDSALIKKKVIYTSPTKLCIVQILQTKDKFKVFKEEVMGESS